MNNCIYLLILLLLITLQININNCEGVICERCYCKNVLINNVPETCVTCSHKNLKQIYNVNYDSYQLDYSYNKINNLNGTLNSIRLIVLDLSYNEITTISDNYFNKLTQLTTLDLSHNKLGNINNDLFDKLIQLERLYLQKNELKSLPQNLFMPLHNLLRLDLSYNYIDGIGSKDFLIDLIGLNSNVTHLTLNNVNDTFDKQIFVLYNNLQEVSIADNNLNEIPLFPIDLIRLDLSGNNFTELKAKDFHYKKLKVLKLNRLRKLSKIHDYAFYHLTSLEELYIENCPKLRKFNDLAFENIENDVKLPMRRLSLSGCGLESLNQTYLHLFNTIDMINLQNNPWLCNCDIAWLKLIRKSKMNGYENTL